MHPRRITEYTWKDYVRISAGVVMLVLGVLGLVFPILQGILFLIVAGFLLAPYSRRVRRGLAFLRLKFPQTHERARTVKHRYFSNRRNV